VFQKTVAINDFYLRGPGTTFPLGHIQSQGRTHGVMARWSAHIIRYSAWATPGCRAE
jgi:hypothetical protein